MLPSLRTTAVLGRVQRVSGISISHRGIDERAPTRVGRALRYDKNLMALIKKREEGEECGRWGQDLENVGSLGLGTPNVHRVTLNPNVV